MVYADPARRNERELNFGIAPDAPPQTEGSVRALFFFRCVTFFVQRGWRNGSAHDL